MVSEIQQVGERERAWEEGELREGFFCGSKVGERGGFWYGGEGDGGVCNTG